MAFPFTALPIKVEIDLNGTWTDISSYVQRRTGLITVQRGRTSEASQADPSIMTMNIDNRDGRFSSRNPTGPYYGVLGRNTPIRISVEEGPVYLNLDGTVGSKASAPDSAGTSVTGDIDVRIDLTLDDWVADIPDLMGKNVTSGNQRSWFLYIGSARTLTFQWSANGSTSIAKSATTTFPNPPSGRVALRATLDVDNGAAGNTVTFYYGDSVDGPWTQIGSPVVTAGTTSIFDSTAATVVGDIAGFPMTGKVYAIKVLNGIAGTAVANPNFEAQASGATSFADAAGNTWTLTTATLTNRRYRFYGEVSSWPQRWDPTGTDVWVPIEAAGVTRRLRQSNALSSTLYRALTTTANTPVAYWPCEDGAGAVSLGSAIADGTPLVITGSANIAAYSGFDSSAPVPILNDSQWDGSVPGYTATSSMQLRFLMAVPAAGIAAFETVIVLRTSGNAYQWSLFYNTGGTLRLIAFNIDMGPIMDTGDIAFDVNGKNLWVSIELTDDGSGGVDATISTLEVGQTTGVTWSDNAPTGSVGAAVSVIVDPGGGMGDTAIGHIAIQPSVTSLYDLANEVNAWRGETAGHRIDRLCGEAGIDLVSYGNLEDTELMGPQKVMTVMDLLVEAATTDDGILFEPRDRSGVGYRTKSSLYNQPARVDQAYSDAVLSEITPTDDDKDTKNDVTVSNGGGSSSRYVIDSGPLSINPPPNGVGRYSSSVTVSVSSDSHLEDQASWRAHKGTIDEARYPQLTFDLTRQPIYSVSNLVRSLLEMESGDKIAISDPPSYMPPDDIEQLVQGYSEIFAQFEHKIVFNCTPESPYHVAVYGTSKYESSGSTLSSTITSSSTSISIATASGPLWTTDGGQVPFSIKMGGEVMTVTAVSGGSSPQTFTVTRSVNGVVKAHTAGATLTLWPESIYAL